MRRDAGLCTRSQMANSLVISIIVPVFNEAAALTGFHAALKRVLTTLPHGFRILYVDDGSTDGTTQVLAELQDRDKTVTYLSFSRNFGHQAALTAGLENVDGDIVIMMDGDGQHPPELIPEM